jgi:type IV pilus assembly protein PilW
MNLFNKQHSFRPRHCRGFSMVELMIALVISLILMGGISQIFLSSKKSFTIQDTLGRQQENGRYVIESLGQDVRRAGYLGSLEGTAAIGGTAPEVTDNGTCPPGDNTWGRMLGSRIFGLNDTNVSNISGSIYACIPNADYLRGDILVVRYQAPWIVGGLTTPSFEANRLYLRTSLNLATMFKGSDEDELSNGLPVVVGREAELIARAYYVGPSGTGTCNGAAVPALFRESLDANGRPVAEELAYGVENLQVRYGIDTPPIDGSVDKYVDAGDAELNTLAEWNQVIAARVWILTRGECPETGLDTTGITYTMGDVTYDPGDTANRGYRRQVYQTTITLRNRIRQ